MLINRLCGNKRKREPHTRSVKASRMKGNQGKEWKLTWEGETKCMKAQREPRNGEKVSKGETSVGKSAHKLFQEFLKRIGLTLFFLSSHSKPFNHMWSFWVFFLTVVFVLYIVFQSYNILCNVLFEYTYQVQLLLSIDMSLLSTYLLRSTENTTSEPRL